ncbi:hypothetical protein [Staphylococcus phage Stab20]|nr:hypothetical protein [Staphylococcus phage Stab20]
MKAESIARFFQGKVLQIEGYKVRFTQSKLSILEDAEIVVFLEVSVYTLSGTHLLDTDITVCNPDKIIAEDLYTEIGNKLQEIVGDQTKTDIELSRYFKEVE